jgi:hypothetical protein
VRIAERLHPFGLGRRLCRSDLRPSKEKALCRRKEIDLGD